MCLTGHLLLSEPLHRREALSFFQQHTLNYPLPLPVGEEPENSIPTASPIRSSTDEGEGVYPPPMEFLSPPPIPSPTPRQLFVCSSRDTDEVPSPGDCRTTERRGDEPDGGLGGGAVASAAQRLELDLHHHHYGQHEEDAPDNGAHSRDQHREANDS